MTAAERHNRLVTRLFKELVIGSDDEAQCYVNMESILLGVMLHYRPEPRQAAEFLDAMTARVIDRHAKRTKG